MNSGQTPTTAAAASATTAASSGDFKSASDKESKINLDDFKKLPWSEKLTALSIVMKSSDKPTIALYIQNIYSTLLEETNTNIKIQQASEFCDLLRKKKEPHLLGKVQWELTILLHQAGRNNEATAMAEEAMAIALENDDKSIVAEAAQALYPSFASRQSWERAIGLCEMAKNNFIVTLNEKNITKHRLPIYRAFAYSVVYKKEKATAKSDMPLDDYAKVLDKRCEDQLKCSLQSFAIPLEIAESAKKRGNYAVAIHFYHEAIDKIKPHINKDNPKALLKLLEYYHHLASCYESCAIQSAEDMRLLGIPAHEQKPPYEDKIKKSIGIVDLILEIYNDLENDIDGKLAAIFCKVHLHWKLAEYENAKKLTKEALQFCKNNSDWKEVFTASLTMTQAEISNASPEKLLELRCNYFLATLGCKFKSNNTSGPSGFIKALVSEISESPSSQALALEEKSFKYLESKNLCSDATWLQILFAEKYSENKKFERALVLCCQASINAHKVNRNDISLKVNKLIGDISMELKNWSAAKKSFELAKQYCFFMFNQDNHAQVFLEACDIEAALNTAENEGSISSIRTNISNYYEKYPDFLFEVSDELAKNRQYQLAAYYAQKAIDHFKRTMKKDGAEDLKILASYYYRLFEHYQKFCKSMALTSVESLIDYRNAIYDEIDALNGNIHIHEKIQTKSDKDWFLLTSGYYARCEAYIHLFDADKAEQSFAETEKAFKAMELASNASEATNRVSDNILSLENAKNNLKNLLIASRGNTIKNSIADAKTALKRKSKLSIKEISNVIPHFKTVGSPNTNPIAESDKPTTPKDVVKPQSPTKPKTPTAAEIAEEKDKIYQHRVAEIKNLIQQRKSLVDDLQQALDFFDKTGGDFSIVAAWKKGTLQRNTLEVELGRSDFHDLTELAQDSTTTSKFQVLKRSIKNLNNKKEKLDILKKQLQLEIARKEAKNSTVQKNPTKPPVVICETISNSHNSKQISAHVGYIAVMAAWECPAEQDTDLFKEKIRLAILYRVFECVYLLESEHFPSSLRSNNGKGFSRLLSKNIFHSVSQEALVAFSKELKPENLNRDYAKTLNQRSIYSEYKALDEKGISPADIVRNIQRNFKLVRKMTGEVNEITPTEKEAYAKKFREEMPYELDALTMLLIQCGSLYDKEDRSDKKQLEKTYKKNGVAFLEFCRNEFYLKPIDVPRNDLLVFDEVTLLGSREENSHASFFSPAPTERSSPLPPAEHDQYSKFAVGEGRVRGK